MLKNKEEEKEEEVNRAGKQEKPTIQVLDEEDSDDDETSLGGYNESEINYDLDYEWSILLYVLCECKYDRWIYWCKAIRNNIVTTTVNGERTFSFTK